jgi:hypothetical protein
MQAGRGIEYIWRDEPVYHGHISVPTTSDFGKGACLIFGFYPCSCWKEASTGRMTNYSTVARHEETWPAPARASRSS